MPGGVDQQSTPNKVWLVIDQNGQSFYLLYSLLVDLKELTKGLESSNKPRIVICNQFPSITRPYSQRILLMFGLSWHNKLSTPDYNTHGNFLF